MSEQLKEVEVAQYDFRGSPIRVMVEPDGTPLFCGRDVASALGYVNTKDALAKHCRGVAKRYPIVDSLARTQEARFITEGDLYRLIVSSRLPEAEELKQLVFDEVLPSIRKNKSSLTPQKLLPLPVASLVERDTDGNTFTTSLIIADGTGAKHKNVLETVKNNITDFEEFGRVAFETRPFETAGGIQNRRVALLNREQATLLMTYMRNNAIVRDFKKRLVHAFSDMEKRAHRPTTELTRLELIKIAMQAEEERLALETKNKELTPKAGAWDTFCSSGGDMSVADAAKALASRAGVCIGRNRLFDYMKQIGWLTHCHGYWEPLQYAVERGLLAVRVNMPRWKDSGESFIPKPTVRVTSKGLDMLAERLSCNPLSIGGAA